MQKINLRRVILGGMAAGLLFDVLEFGLGQVVGGRQFIDELQALGRPMQPSAGGLLFSSQSALCLDWFLFGFMRASVHATVRDR